MSVFTTLLSDLRTRLGETSPGFWQDNELMAILNRAQKMVAEDLQDLDIPWAKSRPVYIPVYDTDTYVMPTDVLGVVAVTHEKPDESTKRPLIRANVRSMINSETSPYESDFYQFFQMDVIDRPYIAEGVATAGTPTTLTDTNGALSHIRIGDIIFNQDDNDASAIISAINLSTSTISFGEWRGGTRDSFQAGDTYRIGQQERTRDAMYVYPRITIDDQEEIYDGAITNITAYRDIQITGAEVTISTVDSAWNETTVLPFYFYVGQSQTNRLVEGNVHNPKLGVNELAVADPDKFILRHNTRYDLTFPMDDSHITNVRLTGSKVSQERLNIEYTPYPRELTNTRSVCELRPYQQEPMLRKAKRLAMEKRDPMDYLGLQTLDLEYQQSLSKCRDTMMNREPGPDTIHDEERRARNFANQEFAAAYGRGIPWGI